MIHKVLTEGGISGFKGLEIMFVPSGENDDRGNICNTVCTQEPAVYPHSLKYGVSKMTFMWWLYDDSHEFRMCTNIQNELDLTNVSQTVVGICIKSCRCNPIEANKTPETLNNKPTELRELDMILRSHKFRTQPLNIPRYKGHNSITKSRATSLCIVLCSVSVC